VRSQRSGSREVLTVLQLSSGMFGSREVLTVLQLSSGTFGSREVLTVLQLSSGMLHCLWVNSSQQLKSHYDPWKCRRQLTQQESQLESSVRRNLKRHDNVHGSDLTI